MSMLLQLFLCFLKVGLLGFGGGLAIVRLIYDSIQPFMDMSSEMFANIVAISQITPGPLAVNVATYVGYEANGIAGAAIATFGVILSAFIILSIAARMIQRFKESRVVNGILAGIRPATMGLIGAAAVTLVGPALLKDGSIDILPVCIMVATVVLVTKFKKSPLLVLLIMGCIGAVFVV